MSFELAVSLASFAAGAVAAVAGFGIGSILTPLLSHRIGVELAIAAVSIPHLAATAVRFLMLRTSLDWAAFRSFGVASAAGGLTGALLHGAAGAPVLRVVFASLLLLAAASELFGLARRVELSAGGALVAGGLSGFFGGLVGNQGGIRSAAMLALPLRRDAFVATATATGLLVDAARMPVYFTVAGRELLGVAPLIAVATAGALAGTFAGRTLLGRIPERAFRLVIAGLLVVLALWMLAARR
ncbi:MAG TPA: TSUP family transporter [Gemmatimonadales bacterium]